jgi:NAD(P)-dependent dehydrogenase (short-subunit alcohol dehydrogenase family)
MERLINKVALITGAAQGIGEAIVRAFIAEGAFVIISDINKELADRLAAEHPDQTQSVLLDVTNEQQWQQVMKSVIARHTKLDILVNNAGITGFEDAGEIHDPEHASLAEWRRVHEVNLDGTFLGCKYAIKAMRPNSSASIINMSSRSGLVGIPAAAAYASSKAAIRNHSKSVALYCAQQGLNIRCNSIHPAAILTPIWEPMLGTGAEREQRMKDCVRECPMKRFGQPDEVAALAVLLASDEAAYINGSELNIDGGILAGSVASPAQAED